MLQKEFSKLGEWYREQYIWAVDIYMDYSEYYK